MDNEQNASHNHAAIRAKLEQAKGKQYWRSLEELAETQEFRDFLEDEFPNQMRPLNFAVDRRQFFTLMGASLALAGVSGCRFLPQQRIVPYVDEPEDLVVGIPLYYATAYTQSGYAIGLVAESHEGRPTKLEGNANHPSSLGSTNIFAQAAILNLYDPDRSANVTNQGDIANWEGSDGFLALAQAELAKQKAKGGAGLRILTETVSSPTLAAQMKDLLAQYPQAKWVQYEPVNRDNVHAGSQLAFGQVVNTVYHADKAKVIVDLDANFLIDLPGSVRYARDFSEGRQVRHDVTNLNRLYAIESTPNGTGATADHVLSLRPTEIEAYARALAAALGVNAGAATPLPAGIDPKWIAEVAKDLQANHGAALVVVGERQSPFVHALGHAMNAALGGVGATVSYTDPVVTDTTGQTDTLRALVAEMDAGHVEMLLILGGNPVYNAPADIDFGGSLHAKKVAFSAHLGYYEDETSALCLWHVPEAHFLEAWSDTRGHDGTVAIVQPLIQPLLGGKSPHEVIAGLAGVGKGGYDLVHDYWRANSTSADYDRFWEKTLFDGVVADTALPTRTPTLNAGFAAAAPPPAPTPQGIEVIFQPDPTIWDGRFANNGWLQELPKPFTHLTWDNTVLMSPATAVSLGLTDAAHPEQAQEHVLEVTVNGKTIRGPVWLMPNHPDNAVTLHMGYGRTHTGHLGKDIGFNVNPLRASNALWSAPGQVAKTDDKYILATTTYQHTMGGRDLIRIGTIEEYRQSNGTLKEQTEKNGEEIPGSSNDPQLEAGHGAKDIFGSGGVYGSEPPLSLYNGEEFKYDGYAWGMSVDLSKCIGCNACIIACQSENNIPVVSKDQVKRGRAMHWIRIDTYYTGPNVDRPEGTYFEPVMCQHCEQAPCEPVCPVAATVHSHEGLNQMVYNRCVGTKYCSNNCPYKVRRFNFYKYTAGQPDSVPGNFESPIMRLMANPNVTVRGRGVMEKCSFCVQRINAARITAKKENRLVKDGEIVTACQQACPTKTIVFGDIRDPNAQVHKLKAEPHDYSLLGDLDTRPRLTYLAKIRNPNPALETEAKS